MPTNRVNGPLPSTIAYLSQWGEPEQLAALVKMGIDLPPVAMARVDAFRAEGPSFTASASTARKPQKRKPDYSALWGPVLARHNAANGFK